MSHNLSKLYQSVMGVINSSDASTTKENANKDAKLIPTQRDLVAGVVAKAVALDEILPKHVANAHVSGDIHFHDLDYSPLFPMFNCMLINYENMLKYGFKMGSADIDTPKSITTACAVTAQIVASVASNIYGGNTLSRIDEILAPYVTASAKKHHDRGERYGLSAAQLERYVQECTEKECYDAFQALEYEINTLQTSNGQTPFCTINFGLGTSWESKLIQEAILKNRIRGLGKNGETPAFPKLVYTIKKGVNFYPNDPNYNIKKLALECSVKRMYPDILNYDKVVEVTGDFKPPMGCVEGEEVVTFMYQNSLQTTSFETLWNIISNGHVVTETENSAFVDTSLMDLYIHNGDKFTKVKKVICNFDQNNWYRLTFSGGRQLVATADHPLPVEGKGRTFVENMQVGDEVKKINSYSNLISKEYEGMYDTDTAYALGLIICDAYIGDQIRISLDHRTEQDVINKIVPILKRVYPDFNVKVEIKDRAEKGVYTDITVQGTGIGLKCKELQSLFNGEQKINRSIPSSIMHSAAEIRAAFFAGMMDADGYVRKSGNHYEVSIGSTNKKLAIMTTQLLGSLGFYSKTRTNSNFNGKGGIRYITEVSVLSKPDFMAYMACQKKTSIIQNEDSKQKRMFRQDEYAKLKNIEFLGHLGKHSYDVETEDDMFNVSGLHSHNCRSFLGSYHDEQGNPETLGRNNLGVVTVNLPRIAIRASGSVETFYRLLDEQLQICFDALMLRIERLKTVKAKTAPILYTEGACGVRLDPEDYVIDIFKNGRASISLGYIGIHETICSLFNTNKVIGEYEREALKIVTYLRSTVERWKKETSWGFSLYSTPAESLCYRFCRLDREQYGEIENVTDKEYYTNSFHLDVREKVTPFDKIEFEMGYPSAASGGFITFWESNSLRDNPEALETVWDFTYDRVPYFASNFPTDKCFECGYDGEFTASVDGYCCPKCGNNNPERMDVTRRVCGYLGKAGRPFNHGKQIEVTKRIKHM